MEGAAQALVSNVGQLVGKEFRQLRGVGGEVARLRNELATMNALLRMQSEADEGAVDHFVREWMKQLREVAYDAEDCVDLYLFRVSSRSGDRFLAWCKRLLKTLPSRHQLAADIRSLRAHASAINEHHARYGVGLDPLRRCTAAAYSGGHHDVQAAVAAASPPRVLRRDINDGKPHRFVVGDTAIDIALAIASKVEASHREDDDSRDQLKVFSIVGLGGIGKTTLALEVCRRLGMEFPLQAHVSVWQAFSVKDLRGFLKRVLRQMARPKQTRIANDTIDDAAEANSLDNIDNMPHQYLEEELKRRTQNKRYLIVIDDVWSIEALSMIMSSLPRNNCGSRIIVTTRIDAVAKACSDANDDYYIHRMNTLDEADSKQLFMSIAFGSAGNPCSDDKELEAAITSILRKCGWLPLAIVSIASLLAGYTPPEGKKMWEIVERSIGSQMEYNPTPEGMMRQILTLSYNHLPHHLKACVMYLSIFPEDYMISKDQLLKRWIAEGLIAEKRGLTQMELAEVYFNELMSRSIIDWAANGREDRFRVHDMMLEILVSKSLEANFVSLVGGQYEGMSYDTTVRRLSIHGGVDAHKDSGGRGNGIQGMMMQHVRSLSIFDPTQGRKLLSRLDEFTLLRVLDLEGCEGLDEKHMGCICQMYLLRFLSLRGTDIKVIPPRVVDLEHLQTLDVSETYLKGLPETVKNLKKLENLLISNKRSGSGWMLPQGINKMKALRQLNKAVVIYDPKVANEIGELDQLQELALYVDTRKEMNMEVLRNLAFSLSKMYSLRWLDIGNFGCSRWPFVPVMKFLHDVGSPPRLLRYLRIWGCVDRLPHWVGSLADLTELDIAWTYLDGVQLFNVLCKLPNLKRLSLGPYFIRKGNDMVAGRQSFPVLKELTLGYSPEVPRAYMFEEGSMPKLEMLVVNFGDQNKHIVGIDHLTNLKEVHFNGLRSRMKEAVEQLVELNKERPVSAKISIRVTYDDE